MGNFVHCPEEFSSNADTNSPFCTFIVILKFLTGLFRLDQGWSESPLGPELLIPNVEGMLEYELEEGWRADVFLPQGTVDVKVF